MLHRPVHRIWDSEAGAGCLSLSARHLRGVLRALTPRGPRTLGFLQSGKAAGVAGGAGCAGDQGAVCFNSSHPRPPSAGGEKGGGAAFLWRDTLAACLQSSRAGSWSLEGAVAASHCTGPGGRAACDLKLEVSAGAGSCAPGSAEGSAWPREGGGQGFWGSGKGGILVVPKGPCPWAVLGSFSRRGVFGGGGRPSGSPGKESVPAGLGGGCPLPSVPPAAPPPLPIRRPRGPASRVRVFVGSGRSLTGWGALQYLGKPPSRLCSGFFSELGVLLLRSWRALPRDVAHVRATRPRPPPAPVTPGGLRPRRGRVCSGVRTACVRAPRAAGLGLSPPHRRQPRCGRGRGPAGVSMGLEGTAGAKTTPGQRRPLAPAPVAMAHFLLSLKELQLTYRVVSSCHVDTAPWLSPSLTLELTGAPVGPISHPVPWGPPACSL